MRFVSLAQCIPMEIFVIECSDPASAHCHMLLGVTNNTPPVPGEVGIIFYREEEDLYFRPLEETLLSLN